MSIGPSLPVEVRNIIRWVAHHAQHGEPLGNLDMGAVARVAARYPTLRCQCPLCEQARADEVAAELGRVLGGI